LSILVTGASGFLGHQLVDRLIDDEQHIIAVSRNKVPDYFSKKSSVEWLQCDIAREELDLSGFSQIEAVFHLAGVKELGEGDDENLLLEANETLTVKLVNSCAKYCKKLIFASSQMVYGNPGHNSVTEEFPLLGYNASAYACSKLNTENWLRYLQKKYNGLYLSLRFCGFIEGGGNIDYMINQALQNKPIELYSRGEVCRDYLTVDKGIDAFIAALQYKAEPCFAAFNIGFGQVVSTHDIAKIVCAELNSISEIILSDKPAPRSDFIFNIDKAVDCLGYETGDLRDSIRKYTKQKERVFKGVKNSA